LPAVDETDFHLFNVSKLACPYTVIRVIIIVTKNKEET